MKRLIDQLIVNIRYDGLLDTDIECVVKETLDYFRGKGFIVREGTHTNIGVNITDPESINGKVNPNTETIKKYMYDSENISICVSKYAIDMLVAASIDYKGFCYYMEYLSYIIKILEDRYSEIVNITRIGVRKINSLFIRDIDKIDKYFKTGVFNCCEINKILDASNNDFVFSRMQHTLVNDAYKLNINTEVHLGDGQIKVEDKNQRVDVYRNILDIDAYWDRQIDAFDDTIEKINDLNGITTEMYYKCLNDNFNNDLRQNSEIDDDNIFGGIK